MLRFRAPMAALALLLLPTLSGYWLAEVEGCSNAVPEDYYEPCTDSSSFCGDFQCLDVGGGRMRCTDRCSSDADCPDHPTGPARCVDSICQEIICEG